MRPILYSGTKNASSWAMRAWLALQEAGYDFEERIVDIRRPQRYANLKEIAQISPSASVPVLVIDQGVIFDSLAIMEFANDLGDGNLLPRAPHARARARSLVAWQHAGLSNLCTRISFESAFYPYKRNLSEQELTEAARIFDVWEQELSVHQGPYLFGDVSLADFAFVPTIIKFSEHGLSFDQWPRMKVWIDLLRARRTVQAWMTDALKLPPIWFDDYLIPGEPAEWHARSGVKKVIA